MRVGLANQNGFSCPLTQEELGDALGLTSVHINRVLRQLRSEGLLVLRRPTVGIPDLRLLHAAGGFDGDVGPSQT